MSILEDEFSDVIAKAMAGMEIDAEDLAKQAGVSSCEVSGLLHGDLEEHAIRKICPVLGLDAGAVNWTPRLCSGANGIEADSPD